VEPIAAISGTYLLVTTPKGEGFRLSPFYFKKALGNGRSDDCIDSCDNPVSNEIGLY
jgi:hypothetical protein